MATKTITRADLAESIYQQVGLSRNESSALVEMVLDEIANSLLRGNTVKISSFGSFSLRQKAERLRSPQVPAVLPEAVQAFGISGGVGRLFASHPPIEERIAALQAG